LSQDKKVLGKNKISFIFLKGIGKPAVKQVTLNSILKEIKRQAAE
jgi:3-dehydroquinate synthetase